MKWQLIVFCFLITLCSINYAQTVGGSFVIGIPQNEFNENVDNLGYGFEIHGTIWKPEKKRPFTVGLNLGYLIYGSENQARPLSHTIPDILVDVNRQNSIVNFHLLFQIAPFTGTWRPYFEGLAGGNYIFTTTEVESQHSWGDNENIAESTNFDDFSWSFGCGAGLLIRLKPADDNSGDIYLNLKARYLWGTKVNYLTEGDININPVNYNVEYNLRNSKTDLFTINIGVDYYF
jgi:hypothetical protein